MEKPNHRLFLVMIMVTFAFSGWVNVEPALFDLLLIGLFVIACLARLMMFNRPLLLPLFLLWAYVLSNLWSMYGVDHFGDSFYYLAITGYLNVLWFTIIGVTNRFGEQGRNAIIWGYVAAGVASAVSGIAAYWGVLPLQEFFLYLGRVKGLFKDPNVFGPFLVPIAMLSIMQLISAVKRSHQLFWLFSFLVTTVATLLSYSRAAWMNYIVSFLLLFALLILIGKKKESARRLLYLFVGSCVTVVLLLVLLNTETVGGMMAERFKLQKYDEDRFATQTNILDHFEDYMIGVGPGQSERLANYAPHSLYVRVLGENGIFGFTVLMGFLALTLFRSFYMSIYTKHRIAILCTACLVGLYVNSIVIDTLHWRHFWILLAIPWTFSTEGSRLTTSKGGTL
ncbi:O-antigen ligase family protein [Lentibacillus saliphilus]|uniref:O-antigen ligase family protein n=1 Tax=Lentibacillus saliphilus TaxID=2737028 RepID=UPI001C30CDC5|nr:O-antigen ligase family protein [Lentibacillus saliphilus]